MQKNHHNYFVYGAVFVYLIVFLILYAFHDYPHVFTARAGFFPNFLGIILLLMSFAVVFFGDRIVLPGNAGWMPGVAWAALFILGFCTCCGWNFDLHGVPNIP